MTTDTVLMRSLRLMPLRRPRSTLSTPSAFRVEVRPPSLRHAPASWGQRLLFWLLAPAPQDAAPPINRLPGVKRDCRLKGRAGISPRLATHFLCWCKESGQRKHLNAIWPSSGPASARMEGEDRIGGLARSGLEQFGCSRGLASRVAERPTSHRASATADDDGRIGRPALRPRAGVEQPNPSMPSIERSEATAALRPDRVRALFFGDFLLGQQKKVTRPPGRDPAG